MNEPIVELLISTGVATVVVAVINGFITRRKLGAEATKIITDAASGVVERVEADNTRLRQADAHKTEQINMLEERVDVLEDREREWEAREREWVRILQDHAAWDTIAIRMIADALPSVHLPDPPPLPDVQDRRVPRR